MSRQCENLVKLLSSGKEGFDFADIKLFKGSDNSTTNEELCAEVLKAAAQIRLGMVGSVATIDRGIPKTNIEQLLT